MKTTGWSSSNYRKRSAPALALVLAAIALAVIAVGLWYVVRAENHRSEPARVGTSQSACLTPPPSIPQGYSPCDPIPPVNETGFQTGDKG
jgi:hypothetical protein